MSETLLISFLKVVILNFFIIAINLISNYACEDSDIALQLFIIFNKKLIDEKLDKIFYNIEIPTMKSLIQMEYNGIHIDKPLQISIN